MWGFTEINLPAWSYFEFACFVLKGWQWKIACYEQDVKKLYDVLSGGKWGHIQKYQRQNIHMDHMCSFSYTILNEIALPRTVVPCCIEYDSPH